MSYILEALKKSDQKRQEGKVPDLQTVSEESKHIPPRRRRWPFILASALLVNAAVFSIWFFTRDSKEPLPVAAPQPAATEARKPPVQTAAPVKAKPSAPQAALPFFRPGKTVDPVVIAQPQKPVMPANSKAAKIFAPPKNASTPPAGETSATQQPAAPPLQPKPEVTPGEVAVAAAPSGQESLDATQAQPPPAEPDALPESVEPVEEDLSPPEDLMPEEPLDDSQAPPVKNRHSAKAGANDNLKKNVLDVMQLPAPIQSKLPKFHISAHFYSTAPPSRLASVNGRVMREGQNFSPGLTLQEITPDGLIFSFEGYLFQVEVY